MSESMTGEEARAIRLALGLTQGQLAESIGVSRTFIGLMERGHKVVSKRTAVALRSVKPVPGDDWSNESDPVLRRMEVALRRHGIAFERHFSSDNQEFDFYLPELSLAIVVDRHSSISPRPTREIRSILIAKGSGTADILSLLLEGRPLRTASPVRLSIST
jgi:transcriptional regulator with XRE-family HTH domain